MRRDERFLVAKKIFATHILGIVVICFFISTRAPYSYICQWYSPACDKVYYYFLVFQIIITYWRIKTYVVIWYYS